MDLLDRYLNAVRLALFWRNRREDIVAELRDDLLTRMEARELELGRPLTDDEVEAVLKANGHPLVAAARYRERQFLIGPTILPFYEAAVVVLVAVIGFAGLIGVIASPRPMQALHHVVGDFISSAIFMVGFATVVAVLLERFEVRLGFVDNWRPRDLPNFRSKPGSSLGSAPRMDGWRMFRGKTRWESLWELVATLVFLSWWTGLVDWPLAWNTHPGSHVSVVGAPVWTELYWPILALGVVQVLASAVRFAQPGWTRPGAALDLASAAGGVVLVGLLATRGPWVEVRAVGAPAEQIAKLNEVLALTIPICLWVAGLIWFFQALRALYLLVRGPAAQPVFSA